MDRRGGTGASAGWKQTENLLLSHCPVPSQSCWASTLHSKITSNFTKVDGVTVLFQLAASAAESSAIRITLSPLPASLCRSSRDINPSLGTALDHGSRSRGESPGFLPGHKTQLQLPRGIRDAHTSAHRLTAWLLFPTERQLLCPLSWQPACG